VDSFAAYAYSCHFSAWEFSFVFLAKNNRKFAGCSENVGSGCGVRTAGCRVRGAGCGVRGHKKKIKIKKANQSINQ